MKIVDDRCGDSPHTKQKPAVDRSPKSTFKNTIKGLPVPDALRQGVDILRVYANGKTQTSFLTLSEDKFTLYLTSERKTAGTKRGSFFGRRKANTGSEERSIDIASIARIQRGHATKRFEMARKMRQDSMRSLISNSSSGKQPLLLSSDGSRNGSSKTDMILNPSRCFSILFRGDWTVDLMMLDGRRDEILDALDEILRTYQQQKLLVSNDVQLLRYVWQDAKSDKEKSQYMNINELGRLLVRLNYQIKNLNDVYDKFVRAIGLDRKMRRQGLTFEQTCTLLHKLKRDSWIVKPVNVYWNKLFGEFMKNGKPRMNVSDRSFLDHFLYKLQGEQFSMEDVRELFVRLNALELPHIAGETLQKDPTRIDKNRFEAYLWLDDNDAFDPARQKFDPDSMHRPISEYWINSSHNTYLTGDQFTSHSSVDMYSNALYRGCRCLELDIWDGDTGDDGLPRAVVWHGHTMTSKILFLDIIKALKLFLNFHPDTFPLVLSFENHCSIPYQEVMADQLVHILGKSLYIPKEDSLSGKLPSPWELRGMVVIKGRRPQNLSFDDYDTDDDASDDGAPSTAPSTIYGSDVYIPEPKKVHHSICPNLARLTLFHGTKLKNWDDSIMNPTHHMHSLTESKVRSLSRKSDRHKWTVYNQTHMSRTYPAGSRIDSSNYMPILAWSVGCQMVSLNFQTPDTPLLLNDGRFRENGGCGYVLKPPSVIELQVPPKEPRMPMKLSIQVLSGSCLPRAKEQRADKCIDPYVKVSLYDVKNGIKEEATTFQTGVVYNNGFFPIWNEEKFKFTVESWPSAMLQLSVFDKAAPPSSDEFVATAAIPVSCLRKGLRSVKLFDATNSRSGAFDFAYLMIEVKKTWGDGTEPPSSSQRDNLSRGDAKALERSWTDVSRGRSSVREHDFSRTGSTCTDTTDLSVDLKSLDRSRTDLSYTMGTRPEGLRLERSKTENSRSSRTESPGDTRVEKSRLSRSRTENSKGEESLAEF